MTGTCTDACRNTLIAEVPALTSMAFAPIFRFWHSQTNPYATAGRQGAATFVSFLVAVFRHRFAFPSLYEVLFIRTNGAQNAFANEREAGDGEGGKCSS